MKIKRKIRDWKFQMRNSVKSCTIEVRDIKISDMLEWEKDNHRPKKGSGEIGEAGDYAWDIWVIYTLKVIYEKLFSVEARFLAVFYDGRIGGYFLLLKDYSYYDDSLKRDINNFIFYMMGSSNESFIEYKKSFGKSEELQNGILKSISSLCYAIMYDISDDKNKIGNTFAWLHSYDNGKKSSKKLIEYYRKLGFQKACLEEKKEYIQLFRKFDDGYLVSREEFLKNIYEVVQKGAIL